MKLITRIFPCLTAVAVLFSTSCQKHPASQIDPNYGQKEAKKEQEVVADQAPEGANPEPPKYFPKQSGE